MKKRYLGIALAALVGGAFVACGSGDVSKPTSEDEGNTVIFDSSYYAGRINVADSLCKEDPVCSAKLNGKSSVAEVSSSSTGIVEPGSSPAAASSSSAAPFPGSSSTLINFSSASVPSSSATVGVSSSAIVDDGTLNGTCEPKQATIEKGATTTWTFVILTPAGMAGITAQKQALFTWTMTGSSEGTLSALGKDGGDTASATYTASGDFTTSLELDNGNKIQCSPLHVNGAKITGCECSADASTVDVASGSATAKWAVSGCKTDATITGYTWTGATGSEASATATLTKKGESIAPTVTVKNDDNTEVSVTCPAVKATDSNAPDYEITEKDKAIAVPSGSCAKIQIAGTVTVFHGWQVDNCSVSMTINGGTTNTDTITNCNCGWKNATKLSTSVSVGDEVCIEYTTSDNTMSLKVID